MIVGFGVIGKMVSQREMESYTSKILKEQYSTKASSMVSQRAKEN